MTIDLAQLILFGILCSALHWLIARSEIARPIWSRATGWRAKLLACPACSGFWLGTIIGGVQIVTPVTLQVAPILYADVALCAIVHGLLGIFVTPVFEAALVWGLETSAIPLEAETAEAVPTDTSNVVTPSDNFLRTNRRT